MLSSLGSWRAILSPVLKRTIVQHQKVNFCLCIFLPKSSMSRTGKTGMHGTATAPPQLRFLSTDIRDLTETESSSHLYEESRHDSAAIHWEGFTQTSLKSRSPTFGNVDEEKEIILDFKNHSRAARRIAKLHQGAYSMVDEVLDEVIIDLLKTKRTDPALCIVQDVVKGGLVQIPLDTYTRILRDLVGRQKQRGDLGYAHQFLTFVLFMIENGYKHDAKQNIEVLRMASLIGNGKLAQVCFDELHFHPRESSYHLDGQNCLGLLFEAHINEARKKKKYDNIDNVLRCFNTMLQKSCEMHPRYIKQLIENSVRGDASMEARAAVQKLRTKRNVYLRYLDVLDAMLPYIVAGDFDGALRNCQGSEFRNDCKKFIGLYR